MIRFTVLSVLSLLSIVNGFGTIGTTKSFSQLVAPKSASRASFSPLFVATGANNHDSPVVRNLEAEMEKAKKERDRYQQKRDQYEQKISSFETKLQELEEKKNQYLEGSKLGQVENNFSETTARSAVKAMMWRVIAGSVTLLTSLKVSGDIGIALKIVGSDFFSKALTMFIGERLMNKSQSGRKSGADSAGRSIAKALIWRLFAICNTLAASLFFSGDLKMASKIAGSDAIFKTGLMIAYERVWAKIEWGKEYLVEFSI